MTVPDISETPLVRRFGVPGARLFARLWFPLLYVVLIALAALFFVFITEFPAGSSRVFIGLLVGGLIVLAASILTKMRLEYWAAVHRLESQSKCS
jgi:hypothetical protein